ncbi:CRIB domain-containing protein RIC6 [Manihot esculenta]|uniref:CRIB domain-containing protein RIC6 n=1 Tax=Manihot esculenta TaxID=3983 RepID=UPI001CC52650|nr:CRIB domain-containing protein RIC6 [Manihot esculenta]
MAAADNKAEAKKMKGLLKGLRYISQIFENEKEAEMQIGLPTDVKHVAHIGWDGPAVNSPSWVTFNVFFFLINYTLIPELYDVYHFNDEQRRMKISNFSESSFDWYEQSMVDSACRKTSRRASDFLSRDLPELPKSSRRHSSAGGAGDSPPKEKTEKKHSKRSSKKESKELTDGKPSRSKDSSDSSSNPDAPKKSRRKKSKDAASVGASTSKSSRSKAKATEDFGSESGPLSQSLNIDNCGSAANFALNENAENGLNEIS